MQFNVDPKTILAVLGVLTALFFVFIYPLFKKKTGVTSVVETVQKNDAIDDKAKEDKIKIEDKAKEDKEKIDKEAGKVEDQIKEDPLAALSKKLKDSDQ